MMPPSPSPLNLQPALSLPPPQRASVNASNIEIARSIRGQRNTSVINPGALTRGQNVTWGNNNTLPPMRITYIVAVPQYGAPNLGAEFVSNLTNTQLIIQKGLGLNDVQLTVTNVTGTNYVSVTLRTSNFPSAKQAVDIFQSKGFVQFPARGGLVDVQAQGAARTNTTIRVSATLTVPFYTNGWYDTCAFAAGNAATAVKANATVLVNATTVLKPLFTDLLVDASATGLGSVLQPPPPGPPSPPPAAPEEATPVSVPELLDQGRTAGVAIGAACIVLGLVAAVAVFIRVRFKTRPPPRAPVNSVALVAKDEEYGEEEEEYGEEEEGEEEREEERQSIGEYEEEPEEEEREPPPPKK